MYYLKMNYFVAAASSSSDNNHGPVLLAPLQPANIETSQADVKRTWYCDVVGDYGIDYAWYKDNKVYSYDQAKELKQIRSLNSYLNKCAHLKIYLRQYFLMITYWKISVQYRVYRVYIRIS